MNPEESIPPPISRRTFLRSAAAASIAARLPVGHRTREETAAVYITDAAGKHASGPALLWGKAAPATAISTIEIDGTREFQPIFGFGAALTDASCYLLSSMPSADRQAFLNETYSPSGLNLSMGRCCVGASDYSRSAYTYDDVPGDLSLQHFTLKHDEAYILPMLREIRQTNPSFFLLATPWSPPGWMKTYGTTFGGRTTENYLDPYAGPLWGLINDSVFGGWMSQKYLDVYSRYLDRFLKGYALAGVPVDALTTQNEVETTQSGRMPACRWSRELELEFIRDHLGPLLRAQHEHTQIWLLDHNYSYWQRVAWQLQDRRLDTYVDGVAWHGYAGTPDEMSLLHRQDPQVPFYWTEGYPVIGDRHYQDDWTRWGGIFTDALENWCRSAIIWNLMLDSRGKPNLGPFDCGGLVTLKDDGSIVKSGQYYALYHFSHHLQRRGRRIASYGKQPGLRNLAARNPDGSFALVLTNSGKAENLRVVAEGKQVSFNLPSNAMATLAWRM